MSSPRIRLRPFTKEDVPQRFALSESPKVQYGLSGFFPTCLELSLARHEERSKSTQEMDFVVERVEDGAIMGSVCYYDLDLKNRNAWAGLWLGEAYHNKGYGSEALSLLLDYLFYEMGLHCVRAGAYAFNSASLRMCQSLGFVVEGRERESFLRSGSYHDAVLMSLLRSEWELCSPPKDELAL